MIQPHFPSVFLSVSFTHSMESSPHFFFMTTPLGWSVNSFFDKIVFFVHIFIFPRDPRATAKRVRRTLFTGWPSIRCLGSTPTPHVVSLPVNSLY